LKTLLPVPIDTAIIQVCSRGHFICVNCFSNINKRNKTVEYSFDVNGFPMATKLEKEFSCPYCREKNNGYFAQCPEKHNDMLGTNVSEEEYKKHIVQCPNGNCSERSTQALMASHVQMCQEEEPLMVTCKHCGEEQKYSNIDKHVKNDCSSLPCQTCDQKVHASNYASHWELHNCEIQHISQMQTILSDIISNRSLRGRSQWFFRYIHTHLSTTTAEHINRIDLGNDLDNNFY
jgi:hypothetical protein